ncbi:MAG: hypothetical protein S0880_02225 [Actinomycetota bacterium]|nr:hypothetical protein [Actinomycetota bacterium]
MGHEAGALVGGTMTGRVRAVATAAALACGAVVLAACGDSEPQPDLTSATADATTTSSTEATTTTAPGGAPRPDNGGDDGFSPLDQLPATTVEEAPTTTATPTTDETAPEHPPSDFVELGYLPDLEAGAISLDDDDARDELLDVLRDRGASNIAAARRALQRPLGTVEAGFAFVLQGCDERSAALRLSSTSISAALTGDTRSTCVAPHTFLAVFRLAEHDVPAGAVLTDPA